MSKGIRLIPWRLCVGGAYGDDVKDRFIALRASMKFGLSSHRRSGNLWASFFGGMCKKKFGSISVVALTALAVACLANASPAEANSIDGSTVFGFFSFNSNLSPNYFDPTLAGIPPQDDSEYGNTSTDAIVVSGGSITLVGVPISNTLVEFASYPTAYNGNTWVKADFIPGGFEVGGSDELNLSFSISSGAPNILFLLFDDPAFSGQTLTPVDSCIYSGIVSFGCSWAPNGGLYSPSDNNNNRVFSDGQGGIGLEIYAGTGSYNENFIFTPFSAFSIPLPSALSLFTTGLGFLGLLGWRRKRKVKLAA